MTGDIYNSFKRHDEKFDAIVIGSGMGGLSVASLLSKAGKKVLLLEKHYIIGGFTHTFARKGYEWDVGLHYVGQVHIEGTALNKVFRYVSNEKLKWAPLDDVYDRAVFANKTYEFVRGRSNLKAKLKGYFPAEKDQESIDKYFDLLDEAAHLGAGYFIEKAIPPLLAKIFGPLLRRKLLKVSDKTTLEVLHTLTTNPRLIGVLTAQYGDYGLPPSKSSFYMHALVANHYMEGAGYPVGGASSIAATMVPVIEATGGAALFSAAVKEIIVEGNKAIGVEMTNGKKIYADKIISDTGVIDTFSSLLPTEVQKKHKLEEKLKHLTPSEAHIGLYGGIKGSPESLKLPRCNYWIFPDEYDHERGRENYKSLKDKIPVAYVSFPAAKDPQSQEKQPDKSTVEAIIIVPYDWFSKWQGTEWKKRGEDYEQMKKEVADRLLEKIYHIAPQLRGKIDYFEVSTPLSTANFMSHKKGEMYGVAHDPERFRQRFLKPYTPVKNLFLTGQDAMVASISGALMGGVLCASAILKKDVLKQIKKTIQ
jgi:all-trans-retinol 13,14-reductase